MLESGFEDSAREINIEVRYAALERFADCPIWKSQPRISIISSRYSVASRETGQGTWRRLPQDLNFVFAVGGVNWSFGVLVAAARGPASEPCYRTQSRVPPRHEDGKGECMYIHCVSELSWKPRPKQDINLNPGYPSQRSHEQVTRISQE